MEPIFFVLTLILVVSVGLLVVKTLDDFIVDDPEAPAVPALAELLSQDAVSLLNQFVVPGLQYIEDIKPLKDNLFYQLNPRHKTKQGVATHQYVSFVTSLSLPDRSGSSIYFLVSMCCACCAC